MYNCNLIVNIFNYRHVMKNRFKFSYNIGFVGLLVLATGCQKEAPLILDQTPIPTVVAAGFTTPKKSPPNKTTTDKNTPQNNSLKTPNNPIKNTTPKAPKRNPPRYTPSGYKDYNKDYTIQGRNLLSEYDREQHNSRSFDDIH